MNELAARLRELADRIERAQSSDEVDAVRMELCDLSVDLCDCMTDDEESAASLEHPSLA